MIAQVQCIDIDDEGEWRLEFKFENDGFEGSAIIEEPYLHSYEEWCLIILGGKLHFTQSYLSCDEKNLTFISEPSGKGNEITTRFSIPIECVEKELLRALKDAKDQGLQFAQ